MNNIVLDFELLFNSTPGCYLILSPDPDYIILGVNDAYLKATMSKREDIINRKLFDAFPGNPDEINDGVRNLRLSLDSVVAYGKSNTMAVQKYDILRADGLFEVRYWNPKNYPIFRNNELIYILHHAEDVTDFVKAQKQVNKMEIDIIQHSKDLQENINRTNSIINSTNDTIVAIDLNYDFTVFNESYRKEFERLYQKKINIGMNMLKILDDLPEDQLKIKKDLDQIINQSNNTINSLTVINEISGQYIENNYTRIHDKDNKLLGICKIGRNITEHKLAIEKAENANIIKTKFFSNISHEFRTPLTLILGPLNDMLSKSDDERLIMMQKNANRLLKMVNSILDFSKLENNKLQAVFEQTNLTKLTKDLCSFYHSAVLKAGLEFNLQIANITSDVYIDKEMWEKIIFNLLSNALKFTLKGSITVQLIEYDECVKLLVSDTGVGIPSESLGHIFERFYRVEESKGRSFEGTGIGLSLVQELIKLHHGKIEVESVVDVGTTFIITIPFGFEHLPKDRLGKSRKFYKPGKIGELYLTETKNIIHCHDKNNKSNDKIIVNSKITINEKILLVDDNDDMSNYIYGILNNSFPNAQITVASNGKVALDIMNNFTPDIILTDVMMPVMNGYQLLQYIRNDNKLKLIPIIMLSAQAGDEAKIEGINIGADDYLVKPFSAKELVARINTQLKMNKLRTKITEETTRLKESELYRNQLKMLVDSVCHEIRNPLNGIYGSIDMMKQIIANLESQKLNDLIISIEECIYYQKTVVDDVLKLSKLESRNIIMKKDIINLQTVMENTLKLFDQEIIKKHISSIILIDPDVNSSSYELDLEYLSEILNILIGNAVKFNLQNGSLTIKVTYNNNSLIFEIIDTGLGIPEEKKNNLFDSFFMGNYNTGNHYAGSGMGLAICKKIVKLMGGDISFESEINKGTRFIFNIKVQKILEKSSEKSPEKLLEKSSEKSPEKLLEKSSSNIKALIVEDNLINQKVLSKILDLKNYSYEIANDGLESINIFKKSRFDIIFMDIRMPNMDGFEATKQIRIIDPNIFIIGVSADARTEHKSTALECGMTDYIVKPYKKEDIYNMINKYISIR